MNLNCVLAAALSLAAAAAAQVPQAIPFSRTLDLLVVDTDYDGVWRLADFNQDGDWNDPGEVVPFYTDTVGSVALTTCTCIAAGLDGTVYVGETSIDIVLALRDTNGDGDANDAGEQQVFFDSATSASGIVMASVQGLTVDAIGRVFAAVSNAGSVGTDLILQLQDLNGDGDANDLGEAIDYCTIPNGAGAVGNSIPTKVVAAPDGNLYYTEVGSTGLVTKGVWKLQDLNFNGHCNDPGECVLYWTPAFAASPFYWSLAVDRTGRFYVTDHSTNERVWTAFDLDASGAIDPSEEQPFYQTTGSTWWDIVLRDDGTVLLCEDQTPDRITALRDLNNDGDALDPGEASQAYDSTQTSPAVAPRGAAFLRAPALSLQPPTVQVGTSTLVATNTTNVGDLTVTVIAFGLAPAPIPLAPWGNVEIDPTFFVSIGTGFATGGSYAVPFAVPNNPAVVGTYAFQSLSGDLFRLFLSNAAVMTVTP